MRKRLGLAVAAVLAIHSAQAQEFIAPLIPPEAPAPTAPIAEARRPSIEGIVAEIFNVKKPWQLVSPLAPAEYGPSTPGAEKTVSRDPNDPEKPKGFIVFGVAW
jgi:hypothetical protein